MRIALALAYDGRGFPGWQTQPGGRAVQDVVERAISVIAGHAVATVCAGRTDAGVHATAQVLHFDTPSVRPLSAWVRGVNTHLPEGVAVHLAREVPETFHARFSAVSRTYRYLLLQSPVRQPLWSGRAGWTHLPLDLAAMRQAAHHLVGEHDFSAFRSSECQARNPVRRLSRLDIEARGQGLAVLTLQANAFLHHMVRNLVGSLVAVGSGRRAPDWLAGVLAGRDRRQAAATFAASGLYLSHVEYPADFGLGDPAAPLPGLDH